MFITASSESPASHFIVKKPPPPSWGSITRIKEPDPRRPSDGGWGEGAGETDVETEFEAALGVEADVDVGVDVDVFDSVDVVDGDETIIPFGRKGGGSGRGRLGGLTRGDMEAVEEEQRDLGRAKESLVEVEVPSAATETTIDFGGGNGVDELRTSSGLGGATDGKVSKGGGLVTEEADEVRTNGE